MAQHLHTIMKQIVKKPKLSIWAQNQKQEKDTALIAETGLKVDIRDNGQTQEMNRGDDYVS